MKGVQEKSKKAHFWPKNPHFEHNKRIFSKTWLHYIFAFVTAYFHEKKKKKKKKKMIKNF